MIRAISALLSDLRRLSSSEEFGPGCCNTFSRESDLFRHPSRKRSEGVARSSEACSGCLAEILRSRCMGKTCVGCADLARRRSSGTPGSSLFGCDCGCRSPDIVPKDKPSSLDRYELFPSSSNRGTEVLNLSEAAVRTTRWPAPHGTTRLNYNTETLFLPSEAPLDERLLLRMSATLPTLCFL